MTKYLFILLFAISVSCQEPGFEKTILITELECPNILTPDSVVNFDLNNLDPKHELTIQCYEFFNNTEHDFYYTIDSISSKLVSQEINYYWNGEDVSNISCDFGKVKNILLASNESLQTFVLIEPYRHEFDSCLTTFSFIDANDSSMHYLKIKTPHNNQDFVQPLRPSLKPLLHCTAGSFLGVI